MAWKRHTVLWAPSAEADLLEVAAQASADVATAIRVALKLYASKGLGDARDPMTAGPWRGRSRLKPASADEYRVIFKRFPMQALIRVERVRLRPVVYLDPPARSR